MMGNSPLPAKDRTSSDDTAGATNTARRPRHKLPRWLVDDAFDRQMADCREPPVDRYPGWLRVVVVVGGSAALWWLIIKSVSALLGGPK